MIPSPNRPRLPGSSTSGGSGSVGSMGPSGVFYNIHQPSARSPLSQETTPFGLFRHKNLSTSALPSNANGPSQAPKPFSPSSSSSNIADNTNTTQKANPNHSPSPVLPPLPPLSKIPPSASPKVARPSFQYTAQYYAWWDYIARDHDELSFKKGDILLVNREFDDLWCLGSVMKPDKRSSARHGFFPLQYCSCESQCYVPTARVARGVPVLEPGIRLSVVLPFNAENNDELTLRPGNQVRAIHFFDDGWVLGEQIDHAGAAIAIGVFPFSAVRAVTATSIEAAMALGSPSGNMPSPSKQRIVGSPLVPTQDIGGKSSRQQQQQQQQEDNNNINSTNGSTSFNTLYSQQNSSAHILQHNSNTNTKLPGSPTSSPFNYRASPPIGPARSPLSGLDTRAGTHPNRVSVQSTSSLNASGRNGSTGGQGVVTEEQVIRALTDRPAQDAVLQLYLAQKGDPNIVDANGNSLLHLAIIAHSQASVVFLLNAPDIRLEHGSPISPLYTAVRFRSWKAAQQLLIQGADPNVHDERGLSVLHIVLLFMTKGDTLAEEVVHLLCDSKADVNCIANDKKIIPLLIAVERELWAEVEILMAYGANPYLIWGRDRRLSGMGLGGPLPPLQLSADGTTLNSATFTGYFNDPLWEAVNEDKVHLVRLLLKFYYAPTSFSATSSSPSPSPSSTQSSQSFFGPQHPMHHSSASSYTTNNGSSSNINIPHHGHSVPMPFAGGGGHGTPPSMPSPSSAQSSPGSAVLVGYMNHRMSGSEGTPLSSQANGSVGSPKITTPQGGGPSGIAGATLTGSFTNASANANMVGGLNPIYVITPKVLLQALTLAKDLGHHDCLQILSRPEVTLKEGTLYGTGSYGYNQMQGQLNGHHYGGHGHGQPGHTKEHRNLIQKLTSLFK
ncbi:hypothetical protein MVEG_02833 [Podila verticillata NRRL 6337]|nr:hypothetical protein MVEG_02833 [Podila verticillata NRRL 6337]